MSAARARPGPAGPEISLLIISDLDGTLVEAVPTGADPGPGCAEPLPDFCARVLALPGVDLACVTGRRAASARRLLGPAPYVIGVHGAELLPPGAEHSELREVPATAAAALDDLRGRLLRHCPDGMRIEDKQIVLTVHHPSTRPDEAQRALAALAAQAVSAGLLCATGRGWTEFRPPGLPDKGSAVRHLVDLRRPRLLAVAGDDHTDTAMFAAARDLVRDGTVAAADIAFVTGPGADPAAGRGADLVLDTPGRCREWLLGLARRHRPRPTRPHLA